jgi:hypothetical protein
MKLLTWGGRRRKSVDSVPAKILALDMFALGQTRSSNNISAMSALTFRPDLSADSMDRRLRATMDVSQRRGVAPTGSCKGLKWSKESRLSLSFNQYVEALMD